MAQLSLIKGGQSQLPVEEVLASWFHRRLITLPDGHRVGVAVAGRGLPVVMVPGFTADGWVYAQTLSRLAGVKVVAIDLASHGKTQPLPQGRFDLSAYVALLNRTLDYLGIGQTILIGHSLGARVAVELAANQPERVTALLLVNGIVGETWDGLSRQLSRHPRRLLSFLQHLILDCARVVAGERGNSKLFGAASSMVIGNLRHLWHLIPPGLAILRSAGSTVYLDLLRLHHVPVYVLHGEADPAVPLQTAFDTAARARGYLTVVKQAGHSWLLQDPAALPVIFKELLRDHNLGDRFWQPIIDLGLDPDASTLDEMEQKLYQDGCLLEDFPPQEPDPNRLRRLQPLYQWEHLRL